MGSRVVRVDGSRVMGSRVDGSRVVGSNGNKSYRKWKEQVFSGSWASIGHFTIVPTQLVSSRYYELVENP